MTGRSRSRSGRSASTSSPNPQPDPFALARFVEAQRRVYDDALAEIRAGRKRTHWMWFIFPQLAGLGRSETARRFAILSLEEARAYLAHPALGARLRECVSALLAIDGRSARDIFGEPDDRKLRSSLTLFSRAAPDDPLFSECLRRYFGGTGDPDTIARL